MKKDFTLRPKTTYSAKNIFRNAEIDCYVEDDLYTPQRAQITAPESFPHYLSVSKRLSMYYMYIVMVAH